MTDAFTGVSVAITELVQVCNSSYTSSPLVHAITFASTNMPIDSDTLRVTLLGAGQEVGRSCCVLQYKGKTVVCDAGIHPAYSGISSLPFVDELDWSTVDAILITQYVLSWPLGCFPDARILCSVAASTSIMLVH